MRVVIFHNVQFECRRCDKPAISLGEGQWAHLEEAAGPCGGIFAASVAPSGPGGYRVGHAMSRVLEAELPGVRSRDWALEQLFAAFNEPGAAAELAGLAVRYRERGLRSLSVGDVIELDGARYACAPSIWAPLPDDAQFRVVPSREPGSASLPECSYCDAPGDETTLEPFNSAARPEVAPWAARIASQAPPLTPEQISRCRAVFSGQPGLQGRAGVL